MLLKVFQFYFFHCFFQDQGSQSDKMKGKAHAPTEVRNSPKPCPNCLVSRVFEFVYIIDEQVPIFSNVFRGGVRTTSFTNKLARTRKYARKKASREEESEQEVCSPEKSLVVDPKQIITSTVKSSFGKSYVVAHLKPPLARKSTSLLSGQPEEEFLINPIQEPEFRTTNSE